MFDFAWSELALIGVVALVVIGPKDLPRVIKNVAFWVRKARSIAREFQNSLEDMVRDAELDDVKRDLDAATRFNFDEEMSRTIDPHGESKSSLPPPDATTPPAEPSKPPLTEAAPGQDLAEAGQAVLPPDQPQEPDVEPPPLDRSTPS